MFAVVHKEVFVLKKCIKDLLRHLGTRFWLSNPFSWPNEAHRKRWHLGMARMLHGRIRKWAPGAPAGTGPVVTGHSRDVAG